MNLIIFDDHELLGKTLEDAFSHEEDVESCYFVRTKSELYNLISQVSDAILLLDINLRKVGIEDSFELAKQLLEKKEGLNVVFLSAYDLPMYKKLAYSIGASGFFSKDISFRELHKKLKLISAGGFDFETGDFANIEKLTFAESEVLKLAAKGLSRVKIAEALHISSRTVGRHLSNIFDKLGVNCIMEAIVVALEKGYIPPIV